MSTQHGHALQTIVAGLGRLLSQAAFDAIASTLPLGSVGYEAQLNAQGQRLVWLEAVVVDKLPARATAT